jgi:hypothetical protein
MNGINGKPFVVADQFIDLKGLEELEKEICYGIAQSDIQAGIYGPGIKDSSKYGSYLGHSFRYAKQSMSDRERTAYESLTRNQRALFFKLYEGMYSASTVTYIREFKEKSITSYLAKGTEAGTDFTENAKYFPKLIDWIYKLPFSEVGRVIFFMHEHDCQLLTHRDGRKYEPHHNEFLWLNPIGKKNFFVYNENTDEKHIVAGKAIFFNDLDMHGGLPVDRMTWTLRVDGKFTDEFRKQLGIDHLETY